MRELAVYDYRNYIENGTVGKRPSVRGVIIRGNRIAMAHSLRYDYYKFPGGGIDGDETHTETLIREVKEETGLTVIESSVSEYGYVLRKEKDDEEDDSEKNSIDGEQLLEDNRETINNVCRGCSRFDSIVATNKGVRCACLSEHFFLGMIEKKSCSLKR